MDKTWFLIRTSCPARPHIINHGDWLLMASATISQNKSRSCLNVQVFPLVSDADLIGLVIHHRIIHPSHPGRHGPWHNEARWAFSLIMCQIYNLRFNFFWLHSCSTLQKAIYLTAMNFFFLGFTPSDWITSTLGKWFYNCWSCIKALFLFRLWKHAGPHFVVIWQTSVPTGVASFYGILKKEQERNNIVKSLSHQIRAIPWGFFFVCVLLQQKCKVQQDNKSEQEQPEEKISTAGCCRMK